MNQQINNTYTQIFSPCWFLSSHNIFLFTTLREKYSIHFTGEDTNNLLLNANETLSMNFRGKKPPKKCTVVKTMKHPLCVNKKLKHKPQIT